MVRRLAVLAGLVGILAVASGCTLGANALGSIGGCSPCGEGNQVKTYARSWARNAQYQQEFFDTYFLLYDRNDPYRCDCPIYDYCPSCDGSGCGYCP